MTAFWDRFDWSKIHRERSLKAYTPVLASFSLCYGFTQRLRYSAYHRGILKQRKLPGQVVSVGNITAGGTGKTPAVAALAKWAVSREIRVCIISRGYGGTYNSPVLEVSDGERILADSRLAGDEPVMLAEKVSGCPVVLSRKRYMGGMYAHERFGSELFILDDGFQHMQLMRDLNLLLMDGVQPFGNGHLLPRGPLREPLDQLKRADAFILTRFEKDRGNHALAFLQETYSNIPVFCAAHVPEKLIFPRQERSDLPRALDGMRVVACAGIGNPETFRETLQKLGADVLAFRGFRDHYVYQKDDLQDLVWLKKEVGAEYILTTEKDWMRMARLWPDCSKIAYLAIAFSFLPGQEGVFRMIEDAIRKK